MTVTYTGNLKLGLPVSGTEIGTWGDIVNQQITAPLDQAVSGTVALTSMVNADYTLANGNGALTNEARYMALLVPSTLTLTAARNIIVPSTSKLYVVTNSSVGGYAVTVKTAAGTGVSVANGTRTLLYCDGTNVVSAINASGFVTLTGVETLTNKTLTTPNLGTPSALVGTNITGTAAGLTAGTVTTNANLTGAVTSTGNATSLGSFTSLQLATALTDETGTGANVFATSPTLTTPVLDSTNGGQLAGLRNRIINGSMTVAQRGTSFAAIATAINTYTLDRFAWFYQNTTAVVTVSQQSDVPSNNQFQSSLRVAVTTADTSLGLLEQHILYQSIEGYNVRDLIGKTYTLSFWVRSSKTGTHCVSFQNSVADRSYVMEYTISVANTWELKTVTVSGGLITAGTWDWTNGRGLGVTWCLGAGTSTQTTANAWQTGNFYATANQVNCMDVIGNIFAVTGVQLEIGPVATPFEQRPYGLELALCQRYGTLIGINQYRVDLSAGTAGGNTLSFPTTPMRVVPTAITQPTFIYTNASGASFTGVTNSGLTLAWTVTAAGSFSVQMTTTGFVSAEL